VTKILPQLPPTIAASIGHFTGRAWLLPPLLDWLERSDQRIFLLTGGPGTGKSMISAWLAGYGPAPADPVAVARLERLRSQVKAVHFCVTASGSSDPKDMAREMAELLTSNVPGFGEALAASLGDQVQIIAEQHVGHVKEGGSVTGVYIANLNLGGLSEELSFNRILRDPLKRLYEDGYHEPMLLLVDALDEAMTYTGGTNIIQLLAKLTDLPSQVRILATTRDDPRVIKYFRGSHAFDLIAGAPAGTDDVRLYVTERLAAFSSELEPVSRDPLATRIAESAKGVFLYASLVLDDLLPHLPDVPDLEHYPLPAGLSGLYHDFLNRELGTDEDRWYESFKPVLGLIAVAQGEGLTQAQLRSFSGKEVDQPIRICKQYLTGELPEGPFRVFHQSFRDFLLEDEGNIDYHIDARTWHDRIAEYFLSRYGHNWTACHDPYCLAYLAQHLHQADQLDALQDLVENPNWFFVRIAGDLSQRGYVADLDLAHNASVQQGSVGWPALMANSLIRASLSAMASYLPPEAYEALARFGRGQEAIDRMLLIGDAQRRGQVIYRLQQAAIDLSNPEFSQRLKSVTPETPSCNPGQETPPEPWLLEQVQRRGAEKALSEWLQLKATFDPDGDIALESHLEIAAAAVNLGRSSEARTILGNALDFVSATWEHHRRDSLLRIARLLMRIGFDEDILRIVQIAEQLEFDGDRSWALSELALLCANSSNEELKRRSLESAVSQLKQAERRSTLQFELSKVALAMSKVNDQRAGDFLEQALERAQRYRQPAWHWEEQRAWVRMACALARSGLCDQALEATKRLPLAEVSLAGLVVELAVRERWDDAWFIALQLHPIARVNALLEAGFSLAQANTLRPEQFRAIVQQVNDDLRQNKLILDHLEKLCQLVDLAQLIQDINTTDVLFSKAIDIARKLEANQLADGTKLVARRAAAVSNLDALKLLQSRLSELPTEEGRHSAELATGEVAVAFAALGQIEDVRSLVAEISDETIRLELYVRIAERALKRDMEADWSFDEALRLARSVQNIGWTPILWARLARMAKAFSRTDALGECFSSAIEGAESIDTRYGISFSVYNCAKVAEFLHKQGLIDEAVSLLKTGLTYANESHLGR
jgi:hypothetical protein